jgi:hypothetical protein
MYKQKPSRADWDEKIVDTINYLLILSAMVDEDIKEEQDNDQPERPDSLQGKIAQAKYKKNDRHKKDMTTDKRMTNLIQATIWEEEKEDE